MVQGRRNPQTQLPSFRTQVFECTSVLPFVPGCLHASGTDS